MLLPTISCALTLQFFYSKENACLQRVWGPAKMKELKAAFQARNEVLMAARLQRAYPTHPEPVPSSGFQAGGAEEVGTQEVNPGPIEASRATSSSPPRRS
eukprot:jgi/Mesvir1/5436/Mv15495-RA.1